MKHREKERKVMRNQNLRECMKIATKVRRERERSERVEGEGFECGEGFFSDRRRRRRRRTRRERERELRS